MTSRQKWLGGLAAAIGLALAIGPAHAQKKYGPGASDTEIKIGNVNPYSGPASAYGSIGKGIDAYFRMVNDQGGINGRKINFITLDDAYSPPRTVEQVRRLVEQDQVLLVFQPLGTPGNTAIQKYMQARKVPQLFVATGATKWNDRKATPGRWAGSRTTSPKRAPTLSTSSRTIRMPRSACSTRTTTTARTT